MHSDKLQYIRIVQQKSECDSEFLLKYEKNIESQAESCKILQIPM